MASTATAALHSYEPTTTRVGPCTQQHKTTFAQGGSYLALPLGIPVCILIVNPKRCQGCLTAAEPLRYQRSVSGCSKEQIPEECSLEYSVMAVSHNRATIAGMLLEGQTIQGSHAASNHLIFELNVTVPGNYSVLVHEVQGRDSCELVGQVLQLHVQAGNAEPGGASSNDFRS